MVFEHPNHIEEKESGMEGKQEGITSEQLFSLKKQQHENTQNSADMLGKKLGVENGEKVKDFDINKKIAGISGIMLEDLYLEKKKKNT